MTETDNSIYPGQENGLFESEPAAEGEAAEETATEPNRAYTEILREYAVRAAKQR